MTSAGTTAAKAPSMNSPSPSAPAPTPTPTEDEVPRELIEAAAALLRLADSSKQNEETSR